MIIESFKNHFLQMKRLGQHITCCLDIGAYRGDFTETLKSCWQMATVWQFEADDRQQSFLNNAYMVLLGAECKNKVPFYTLDDNKITTGSSIFKEKTEYYTDNTTRIIYKDMITLDKLVSSIKFPGNWLQSGMIKLDTQGSELQILKGASNFLITNRPRYILTEVAVKEYNEGAPIFKDYIVYLNEIGYNIKTIFDQSYINGELTQLDILFERFYEKDILD